jgi:hypothetical protein
MDQALDQKEVAATKISGGMKDLESVLEPRTVAPATRPGGATGEGEAVAGGPERAAGRK